MADLAAVQEWLRARLTGRKATAREVLDEALVIGMTEQDIEQALKATPEVVRTTSLGLVYLSIPAAAPGSQPASAPPDARAALAERIRAAAKGLPSPAGPTLTRADSFTPAVSNYDFDGQADSKREKRSKKLLKPAEAVAQGKRILQRRAPSFARALNELTERLLRDDGQVCPTCKRGSPRHEDTRLKAIVAALDRAGIAVGKADQELPDGPAIIFPVGTRVAILADIPQEAHGVARAVPELGPALVRADRLEAEP